ncbi:MAG: YnfA family protein [Flavobacteriales bacterium]
MKDIVIFITAAFFEILGCFAFWAYIRLNKAMYWLIPGFISLFLFAFLLTKVQTEFAGRAYAIYGGIYIVASLFWLILAEHQIPDRWDIIGAGICLAGVSVTLFMPR